MLEVKVKLLHEAAQMPAYAKPGDVGLDLRWCEDEESCYLMPGVTKVLWTGIAIELCDGLEAQVRGRSSFSARGLLAHLGTIDSGYRGNIGVTLTNLSRDSVRIKRGDRVAQLVIAQVPAVQLVRAVELSDSARGDSGFGSSGLT